LSAAAWEPIRRPPPNEYYGFVALLRHVATRLRDGASTSELADGMRASREACDLLRFWRRDRSDDFRQGLSEPTAQLLNDAVFQASNPAIELPPLPEVAQYHAICDFGSWGFGQIADERMDPHTAQQFGYNMHNFPGAAGWSSQELNHAYRQAVAGELPSPGRLRIRELLRDVR
jgi:hypothetical protein